MKSSTRMHSTQLKSLVACVLAALLAVTMMGVLTACGSSSLSTSSGGSGEEASSEDAAVEDDAEETAGFQAQTLYKKDGLTVKVNSVDTALLGIQYDVTITNDSGRDVVVQIEDVDVDGAMADTLFYETVKKGKKANEELSLTGLDEDVTLDSIKEVQGSLKVLDPDTFAKVGTKDFTIKH